MRARARTRLPGLLLPIISVGFLSPAHSSTAREVVPLRLEGPGGRVPGEAGRFSDRTVSLVLEVDRDQARVLAYTLKERPFVRPLSLPAPRISSEESGAQIEVVLTGTTEAGYTQRLDVASLCLVHKEDAEPHVEGDTIRVHRDTFVVEVPEIGGFDKVEVAYYEGDQKAPSRILLGAETLEAAKFTRAGGKVHYEDLAFAKPGVSPDGLAPLTSGSVIWPEDVADPDIYTVFGDPAETAKRINVVIVPDGYTVAEKGTMQSDAMSLVNAFRAKTPYKEHDRFINYILVYAYSLESGTDQCDCSIVKDTAMSTGFPSTGYPCGDINNRCLHYGYPCDMDSSHNIASAELRAPAADRTIVMVNTQRYGGCGGVRAVYAAGHPAASEIATHELAHSLGGLADEYTTRPTCGLFASEINTSMNPVVGAWPEWVPDLGAPWEGAQYYERCIYRPYYNCAMRSLSAPFCQVCNQHWGLVIFGHPRVSPTAPIESMSPGPGVCHGVVPGGQLAFSVGTRLAAGPGVSNSITWRIQGPGYPVPTTVAVGTTSYIHMFMNAGTYILSCEVDADTSFIKPSKAGANVDLVSWAVSVDAQGGDPDGDGHVGSCDNCPNVYNPGQENGDGVAEGDACDLLVLSPADGDLLDCDHPPTITWAAGGMDRFMVFVAWEPDFDPQHVTSSEGWMWDASSWKIPEGRWRRPCQNAHPNLYIKVVGRSAETKAYESSAVITVAVR